MNFVFDLYGTLIDILTDESTVEFWQGIASLLGVDISEANNLKEEYEALCTDKVKFEDHEIELLEVFEDMVRLHGAKISAAELAKEFRNMSIVRRCLFPHVKEILSTLHKKGAGVYLLSNAQSCFTRFELDLLGLTDLFDGILLSSDESVKKPLSEIFHRAFSRFGISAKNSVYVGNDRRDDIFGAHGVGMRTVYIETEQSREYNMPLPDPDFKAKDHCELKSILISLCDK